MFLYVHERLEPDCLVAVIKLSRMCGNRDLRAFIKDLLKTDDERITVELVKWLGDGLDRQDIPILARMLFTRSRAVRKELLSVLEKHRPAEMAHLLRDGILDPRFEKQPASVKEGLCIALGKIERDRAVEFFSDILGKAGLFGKYRKKSATVQAAAMGLAACNTDDAVRVLKKYARGLNAERASACRHALEKRNEL
ncbi:MAG: hypothetical protein D6806_13105 [Deltaproteobacteria bacterium]|nr:MAG: hypothetical protein D6806_13105 [Deltaproteobacteria bacterium]